jgi:hypothetical protein
MKKWLKIGLITFLVLTGILVALPFIFEDRIVARVKTEINKNIRATVDFGDYSLSLFRSFPDFSLSLEAVTVDGVAPFEGTRLADIGRFSMTLDIMSVLRGGDILVKDLSIQKPIFHFRVLKDGTANWDIADTTSVSETPDQEGQISLTRLQRYAIDQGVLTYTDESMALVVQLNGLEHQGKGDFGASVFNLSTTTQIDSLNVVMDGIRYFKDVEAEATMDLGVNTDSFRFTFLENQFRLNALEFGVDGFFAMPADDMEMDLSLNAPKTDFRTLFSLIPGVYQKDFAQVKTSGKATLQGKIKGVYSEAQKLNPAFDFAIGVSQGAFQYPSMPVGLENVNLDLQLRSEGKNEYDDLQIDISRGSFTLDGQPVQFNFQMRRPFSDPALDLNFQGELDLGKIQQLVPMEESYELAGALRANGAIKGNMSDLEASRYDKFKAEGSIELEQFKARLPTIPQPVSIPSLKASITPARLDLGSFSLFYGKSDMALSGYLSNYLNYVLKDELLQGQFFLTSRLLDLNDLKKDFAGDTTPAADTAASAGVIVLPSGVDVAVRAKVDRLLYDNLDIANVSGAVQLVEQKAIMKDVSMDIMGGVLQLNGTYDSANPAEPALDFTLGIKNWDIQQSANSFITIDKLAPIAHSSTGRFSTNVQFKTRLDGNMSPVLESLQGTGNIFTKSVYIEKFKPLNDLAAKVNIPRLAKQTINDLAMYFKVEEGKFHVQPYEVKLGNSKAVAAGYTSLNQDILYKINLDVPRSEFGPEANQWIDKLAGEAAAISLKIDPLKQVRLDITVGGKITSPTFAVKWSEQSGNPLQNLKEELEAQIRQKAEDVKKQVVAKADSVRKEVEETVKENIEETKAKVQAELNRKADQLEQEAARQADRLRSEAKNSAATIRREGQAAASRIESEATNPIQKAGAKLAADKIRKEAEANALKVEQEAERRAVQLVNEAKVRADKIRRGEENEG